MSDNFKNYFFATAFVLFWEFVTDDEGKLGVIIFFDFRIFCPGEISTCQNMAFLLV